MFDTSTFIRLLPELILLVTALVVIFVDLYARRRTALGLLPGLSIVGLALSFLAVFAQWGTREVVAQTLAADTFAAFFKMVAAVAVILVVLASVRYMRARTRYVGEFYAFLLVATLAVYIAVSARDLITLYLGLETLSIVSYVLTGFLRDDKRSNEAAIKYFLYGAVASAIMLYGFSLLYGVTGTTDLQEIARRLLNGDVLVNMEWLAWPAIVLVTVGFAFKASLVPFHQWAPDAYEGAPTPVTMFLSTVSKATGFAVMARMFLVAMPALQSSWTALLYGLAVLTMTLGNLIALRQTSVKRMLAYSSIAHAGFILMGLVAVTTALGQPFNGLDGVLMYVVAYAFTNAGAFAVVAAVEDGTGGATLDHFAGLVGRAPFLAAAMLIFLLSLAGVPPLAGFAAKLFVFAPVVRQEYYVLAVVALINAVLAAGYYLKVVKQMFFVEEPERAPFAVARSMRWALWLMIIAVFGVGIFMNWFAFMASQGAAGMLGL
ncbi:MAG: NADH-quinone oxidoreductase subunit N [Chloroflexi bacterium]|nr:NADH-quinone oxidoreductase subunit N [Chloroflexota bacterium]